MPTNKKTVKESAAPKGVAFLIESELDKAEVVLAAKGLIDKLQKMARELSKVEGDDIMPMLDRMRLTFGHEQADSFNNIATTQIRHTIEAIKASKEALTTEIMRLENNVNGELSNDMGMGISNDGPELGGIDDQQDDDLEFGDLEAEAGSQVSDMSDDDIEAAFADEGNGDLGSAGRLRKESVESNIASLRESANPDLFIYDAFCRELAAIGNTGEAVKAIAEGFSMDQYDVIEAVKEGKTFKDQKDKSDKNKDFGEARKRKQKNRAEFEEDQ